ncbi:MAG: hypothetical protein QUS33_10800 [Dehalococcoidia bacterium]|nr:hypothetical protein [Dehalococcoidia bacterium]
MRLLKVLAIAIVLVSCVVLGSACTGARGEQGPKGDTGATGVGIEDVVFNADGTMTVNLTNGEKYTSGNLTGPQGPKGDTGSQGAQGIQGIQGPQGVPGPNLILAMGCVDWEGNLIEGYNVADCAWVESPSYDRVEITFTNLTYAAGAYVTIVTPFFNTAAYPVYNSSGGKLHVVMFDGMGHSVNCGFSFMILEFPQIP